MPSPRWTNISTPTKRTNWSTFGSVLKQGFRARYTPAARSEYQSHVSYWKTQPTFTFEITATTGRVSVLAVIRGTAAKVWLWLNKGVKPRFIMPKPGGVLAFMPSGPGMAAGPSAPGRPGTSGMIFSKGHWWPGIEARNYDSKIAQALRPKWVEVCRVTLGQAIRIARRQE